MANTSAREKFNLSFPTEILIELRQLAHENTIKGRYTAVSELVETAVMAWLGRKNEDRGGRSELSGTVNPKNSAPSPHQDLIDKLIYILDSDSADAIEAVTTNINVFYRIVKVDEVKAGHRKPRRPKLPPTGT